MIDMDLPGAEVVVAGLRDAQLGRVSDEALALRVCSSRLRSLGIAVERDNGNAAVELYEHIRHSGHIDAYGRYNSLIRRLDSFSAALEQRRRRASADLAHTDR